MILSSISWGLTKARKWLLVTLCLVVSATGFAGVNLGDTLTASKVFAEIPLDVLDMLRPSTRLDMLDYYSHADSILTVQDALGGQSHLEQVTPDYLKVAVTPVSTLEIKLLPSKTGEIIMTLYTVGNESGLSGSQLQCAADTEVRFFDTSLNPLPTAKFLKSPSLKDFFNVKKDSGLSEEDLRKKIPFESIAYSSGPGDAPLVATFTTLSTLSQEDRELLTPLLTPSLSAPWKSSFKFK